LLLFRELSSAPGLTLLNPGNLYTAGRAERAFPFAKTAGATAVLVTTLTNGGQQGRDTQVNAEAYLVDLAAGTRSPAAVARVSARTSDLEKGGKDIAGANVIFDASQEVNTRDPMTRAASDLARQLAGELRKLALFGGAAPVAKAAAAAPCDFTFGVFLTAQKTRAQNYTVTLNGREETSKIRDGVLRTGDSAGPLLFAVTVMDGRNVNLQPDYYANTTLDCGREPRALRLEIGPSGDGVLRWQ
jgi:hypothetical protein